MTEPTLAEVMPKAVRFATIARLNGIDVSLTNIEKKLEKLDVIEKQLTTLDSRFFDSMRVVSANQSAFYSVGMVKIDTANPCIDGAFTSLITQIALG